MRAFNVLIAGVVSVAMLLAAHAAPASDATPDKRPASAQCDAAHKNAPHHQTRVTIVIIRGAASEQTSATLPDALAANQNCTR